MSVIVIDEDRVWGASSGLIYAMIEDFIAKAGGKEYLVRFKDSYDQGYRVAYLNECSVDEIREFRRLLSEFIDQGKYAIFGNTEQERSTIQDSLYSLGSLIDNHLVTRTASG